MDAMTQDYLHNLELGQLDHRERAKLATGLRDCRRRRRAYKDITVILWPLVDFLDSADGKKLVSMLREVLGQTRKEERYLQNRVYTPRTIRSEKEGKP